MKNFWINIYLKRALGTIFILYSSIDNLEKTILNNKSAKFFLFFDNNSKFEEKNKVFQNCNNIETFLISDKNEKNLNYIIFKKDIKKIDVILIELKEVFNYSFDILISTEFVNIVNLIIIKHSKSLHKNFENLKKSHRKIFLSLKNLSIWRRI